MITSLRLQNFRSYNDSSFEFADGVNIIVGPNGSGKTNLLEALLYIARGNSYRGRDINVLQAGKDWARLDSIDDNNINRILKLRRQEDVVNKEFVVDGVTKKRLTAQTTLPVVVFEPNHLQLIAGDPSLRREFLDDLAIHLLPGAAITQRAYRRTLAQRNSLLKRKAPANQFFVWDVRLAELAEGIVGLRTQAIQKINDRFKAVYTELGGHVKSLTAEYESRFRPVSYGEQLMKYLAEHYESDVERGFTGQGPHREDMVFLFDKTDARNKASRGEARTMLLALKIIEMELAALNGRPMLLLDDVFSELDGHRRKALATRLSSYQTFITTTDADVAVENFQDRARIIPVTKND